MNEIVKIPKRTPATNLGYGRESARSQMAVDPVDHTDWWLHIGPESHAVPYGTQLPHSKMSKLQSQA